jgi:chromosome segregation ATPase
VSQYANLTYEVVRQACSDILGRGEKPSRVAVQKLLETEDYLGHKCSNEVVQKYVNMFWESLGKTLKEAPRTLVGVPDAYVAVMDKALVEMVAASRTIVEGEYAERAADLKVRTEEMAAAIEEARQSAQIADQLRLRAEGERNALQSNVAELKENISSLNLQLTERTRQNAELTSTINEKAVEIRHLSESIGAAKQVLEQTNEQHRLEVNRLLKQVDDERQAGQKEARKLTTLNETQSAEIEAMRGELTGQREDNIRMKTENDGLSAVNARQLMESNQAKERLSSVEATHRETQQEVIELRVRYQMAEQIRQEYAQKNAALSETLGESRNFAEQLQKELVVAHELLAERVVTDSAS